MIKFATFLICFTFVGAAAAWVIDRIFSVRWSVPLTFLGIIALAITPFVLMFLQPADPLDADVFGNEAFGVLLMILCWPAALGMLLSLLFLAPNVALREN
ncbi:hypothetical protein [Mesorhizobium sp. Z1-4]|uniref:hypothetical protein n=1 Tax=Mesorhizobium sp. Z1-4 TaxID=2448478 RepID=UPI000FD7E351|nr:hypothetical protein [Mesorhizobium sp. Z1-4]